MSVPRATMRLQFHKGFTFDDAARIIPYLAALHVSHLYASPILMARAGSMHGYDVVDPTQVSAELGGEPAFCRLVAALRTARLGIIVDIVPNHMAVGGADNAWWLDVLRHGRRSRYAHYFDIDWEPEVESLRGKVLVPVLGRPYGDALAGGEISLAGGIAGDSYEARYFHHTFPIAPDHRTEIERSGLRAFDSETAEGRQRLHELLERQNFRLAWWRTANDEINWRRFFDINELAALRVEDEEVFEATHAKLFELFGAGLIDGFRVDHVDGLSDPAAYCRRLRSRLADLDVERPPGSPRGRAYLVVEKILGAGEEFAASWECDGTSGYDFMDQVSAVLHDPAGEEPLGRLWASVSGRPPDFAMEEQAARQDMLNRSFAAQLTSLVDELHRLARADRSTRDITRAAIRRCVIEILVGMRVYRTYGNIDHVATADNRHLAAAVERARSTCLRADRDVIDRLGVWLGGGLPATPTARDLGTIAIRRFQQLSAPLAAKAVEDTAFYRYGRLLSRVDVGFDAARFADSIAAFHLMSQLRGARFPNAMLATATHDHKRGEDVRARLAVLSEISDQWATRLPRWIAQTTAFSVQHNDEPLLSPGDMAILFQMIVGAWPPTLSVGDPENCAAYAQRLAAWQQKALREAKLATDWTAPDEAYEAAAYRQLAAIFADPSPSGLLTEIAAFAHLIAPAGAANGLAQVLLKLTSPGVPDLYQGTDFWDLSLVDPDNRRPVDFDARIKALAAPEDIVSLSSAWPDGRIKQTVIRRSLALRQQFPALFAQGDYLPLAAEGPAADHVIAFARIDQNTAAVSAAARLTMRLLDKTGGLAIPPAAWKGTKLRLPRGVDPAFRNVFTGRPLEAIEDGVPLEKVLNDLPVALLVSGELPAT